MALQLVYGPLRLRPVRLQLADLFGTGALALSIAEFLLLTPYMTLQTRDETRASARVIVKPNSSSSAICDSLAQCDDLTRKAAGVVIPLLNRLALGHGPH